MRVDAFTFVDFEYLEKPVAAFKLVKSKLDLNYVKRQKVRRKFSVVGSLIDRLLQFAEQCFHRGLRLLKVLAVAHTAEVNSARLSLEWISVYLSVCCFCILYQ